MDLFDTIAAISTPYGKGGVAMIRISGRDAVEVGGRVFTPKGGGSLASTKHRNAVYGEIHMPLSHDAVGKAIDDGVATVFYAPYSFTGEDTVEICCHGGIFVTQKVLSAVLCAGARMAQAGEFTRRAYVNGKMKLTEAEALGDLLEAKSDSQLALARGGMRGALSGELGRLYSALKRVLSSIYATIDFPDEDLGEIGREEMISELEAVLRSSESLRATYSTGRVIKEGIPTVICGRANAGKSSIYNRLLGYDAAIVTEVEGTTRDVLRETAVLGRVTLVLCDTAGFRETEDAVESIGIQRSLRELDSASLVLAVFDGTRELEHEDRELIERLSSLPVSCIALVNKKDEESFSSLCEALSGFDKVLSVSALTGEGFDELTSSIEDMFIDGSIDFSGDAVIVGARQYACVTTAIEALSAAISDIKDGVSLDAACVGVEAAMAQLGEVDGREIGEDIVSEIFSRFCVGK